MEILDLILYVRKELKEVYYGMANFVKTFQAPSSTFSNYAYSGVSYLFQLFNENHTVR